MPYSDQEEFEIYKSYYSDERFGEEKHQFNLKRTDKLLLDDGNISLYHFREKEFDLKINPVFSTRNIIVDKSEEQLMSSFLISYGGELILNYSDWLGIYISAYNGVNLGDREAAKTDKRVSQSFSFNYTKINYFDGTEGYIQLQNGFAKLQAGRERVLWGTGNINRAVLDFTPQLFDFIKLDLEYDIFSFSFLHGWMVEKSDTIIVPGTLHEIRTKPSKYFAISRFGLNPLENLSLGISQSVVYAERPFEMAYLNPFLFWESAQRSMNDLDNSFLTFNFTYYPIRGIQINSTFVMDDINFEFYFSDKWNHKNNRNLWQAGVQLTHPILPSQMTLTLEYIQIRPFTFSHPGLQTGLAYTNNGAILSADIEPNSTLLSVNLDYSITPRLRVSLLYENYMHGKNILDASGNLLKNVGGDIFQSYSVFTDEKAKMLDGDLEVENRYTLFMRYYLSAKINLEFSAKYVVYNYLLQNEHHLMIFSTFSYNTYLY
ncbi:MAG: hypothetical protein AB9882_14660 [Ignavibacteriaceae bacterium]